ncbi:MAG: hypothetical protein HYY45_04440 [Deltaproteobacteria bacterium]|nr:hypothetical protein [Deltaproteobacteria bacterium]
MAAIAIPQFAAYRRRGYDSDAKSNVKNAATSEEAYFTDKNTYTATLADINNKGFKQSANIKVGLAATVTDFVITATAAAGCSSNTGIWSFASTSGTVTGTACN